MPSKLREKWLAAREELRRLEEEIVREEAAEAARTLQVRVATAGELYHALATVPDDAALAWDEGDDGPALEVEDKEQRKIWRFLLPEATE